MTHCESSRCTRDNVVTVKFVLTGVGTSSVNIVATATVLTGQTLDDDEGEQGEIEKGEDEGEAEVDSDATVKSVNEEEEEEVNVDVEECSNLDDGRLQGAQFDDFTNPGPSSQRSSRGSCSPDEKNPSLRTSCNSEELYNIECQLETKDLWDKFYELGTEMIITKTGR